ncbi:MAG TPA: amidohydrolase family protein [Thermoanaerobaculia bacterium]|nr:amidohydrolase family protein [Thermoanaerobaculia bacterium]
MRSSTQRGLAAMALAGALALPAAAETVAIVGATVHPVSGPRLDNATVVISDGRVAAVGVGARVPAGARVIDGAGKVVTPGLLDSFTRLGVVEIGAVAGTRDYATQDDRITAAFNVVDAINPFSSLLAVTRVEGITRAVVAPAPGASLISGQGALIDLGAEPAPDLAGMVHKNPVAMFAVLGESGAQKAGGARGAAILRLKEALEDARDFAANRRAWQTGDRRDYALSRLDLEALLPVVEGEVPLAIHVDRAADILATLRLAREYDVILVLLGAADGWMVAEQIAAEAVPVVVNPMQNLPTFDNLGATLENAARLHRAGVTVAFASFDAHNARNLKQAAGNAVAYGMPWEEALRAMTATPAKLWGIADRYGRLQVGMDADLVVWSGDPFEPLTSVEHVFVEGREVPMRTRQTELLERYRTLDEALPPAYRN